jgi:REP element-mobilizing transposase RayT
MLNSFRKTSRLRFGRVSVPEAIYFITFCTKNRAPVLTLPDSGKITIAAMQSMHEACDIALIAATVMPDHVHALLTLGRRLQLGQVMRKIKTLSRNQGRALWRWQYDGFEHRVRSFESIEDYAFYIFMNPYRAGLCPLTASWPWWICPEPRQIHFMTALELNQGVPLEWLGLSDAIASKIATGD